MSQVPDVGGGLMRGAKRPSDRRARATLDVKTMTSGQLADEHRGQGFVLGRATARIADIEAELERRGLDRAIGAEAEIVRHRNDGLLDIAAVKAYLGEGWTLFRKPGSERFWRSKTLKAETTAAAVPLETEPET